MRNLVITVSILFVAVLQQGCSPRLLNPGNYSNSVSETDDGSGSEEDLILPDLPKATHGGWSHITALGPSTPVTQASDLATQAAQVTLSWNAFTLSEGSIDSWSVYRAESSDGQDFDTPLASGIAAGTRTFTDTTAVAGTTYYYVVRPVVDGYALETDEVFSEVKVITPPENMTLIHRWMANKEMCELMGKTPDPENDYRCPYTGPGNVGGYYNRQKSLLVDTFEMGCNYTPAPACGANGCIGTDAPAAGTGVDGNVFYDRRLATCYYKQAGTWKAATDATLLTAERASMASNRPGLPPLVLIDQVESSGVCTALTVSGFAGNKRLLTHQEQILAGAWDASLSDATIDTIENGVNLNTTGHCNSNSGSGLTYDNFVVPADLDTLPGCLNGDCSSTAGSRRAVRTGSLATQNCKSRYGVRDLIGNVWEWASDQLASCDSATHTCTGGSSPLDATNTDWNGFNFDGATGPGGGGAGLTGWAFSAMTYSATQIQLPLGLPMVAAAASSWDYLPIGAGAGQFDPAKFHGDYFYLYTDSGNAARGALAGGSSAYGAKSGRFALYLGVTPAYASNLVGFRCSLPAE